MAATQRKPQAANASSFSMSRVFDVARDVLYEVFTDPEEMAKWWGPKGFTVIRSIMDLRPGGTYHYGLRAPDGQVIWGKFIYREILPNDRLVFVNGFSDAHGTAFTRHPMSANWPLQLLSTFRFEEVDAGHSRFTVTWTPLAPTPAEQAAFDTGQASMQQGWSGTMDQLAAYLAKH